MRIFDLSEESSGERSRIRATIEYEDSDKGSYDVWFEFSRETAGLTTPSYTPFLLGAYTAANHHGEKRIAVEGALCPYLVDNLTCASRLVRWSRGLSDEVSRIEGSGSMDEIDLEQPRESACLLSGGVDSMAMLARNIAFSDTHGTRRHRRAFFAYGLDLGDPNKPDAHETFVRYGEALRKTISQYGVELVPVATNIRDIEPDAHFYEYDQFGGILAGIGYLFLESVERVSMALDVDFRFQGYHGLNLRNAPLMSSEHMSIVGELEGYSRLERVKLLASVPTLIRSLRVCHKIQHAPEGYVNCGVCEKCTRTKLELLAAGLAFDRVFPSEEIDERALHRLRVSNSNAYSFWHELVEHLKAAGSPSGERHVRRALRAYRLRKIAYDLSTVVWRHAHGFVTSPSR